MRRVTILKKWFFHKENQLPVEVEVPHDWAISGPFDPENDKQVTRIVQNGEELDSVHTGRTGGLPHVGKGTYTCTIPAPSSPERRTFIDFDGVMSRAKVYLNGQFAGGRDYGYSSFRINASGKLTKAENEIKVTAENLPSSSRWYPGAGIYRRVRLIECDPVHFAHYGIHLKYLPAVERILLEGTIENHTATPVSGRVTLTSELFETLSWEMSLPQGSWHFARTVALNPCEKWSVDFPKLYDVKFHLEAGKYSDEETLRYGIRAFKFDANEGFSLNGIPLKLNGVCMHHDLGPLGAAFNRAAARRQLELLKTMGCNAIRTSHNPPAPEFLDLCDELGFLVMDEAFDVWRAPKVANDYHLIFDRDSDRDLGDLVMRDRNHPCVILWSIGNEVMEVQDPALKGAEIAKHLVSVVKLIDTERPVTIGLNAGVTENALAIAKEVDIPGWNYRPSIYAEFRKHFPDRAMIGSETLSVLSSRGIYHDGKAKEFIHCPDAQEWEPEDLQCSSYALDFPCWASTFETEELAQQMLPYMAGQFIWSGFDYLGEPTPFEAQWPSRSSYFGCIDLAGIPKDLYYLVQSQWKKDGAPMVHLVPHHWNWKKGDKIDVHVFSNCDTVELFLNGKSLGRRSVFRNSGELMRRFRFIWDEIAWEPGTLKAAGFRAGEICAEEKIQTAGTPVRLVLEAAKTQCCADGEDMLFVKVSAVDKEGVPVPDAMLKAEFSIAGESLKIVAADGGNPCSTEQFCEPRCTLFSGKAAIYLRSTGVPGKAVLTATAPEILPAALALETEKVQVLVPANDDLITDTALPL